MSQENVESSYKAIAALNSDGVEGFLAYCDPDVEWITPPNWLEERVFNGHDGVARAIALFSEQLDEFRVTMARVVDVDDHRVVVLLYQSGRIKRSGHTLKEPLGVATEFRGGKAVRFEVFFSWKEALQAVGLDESP
jgi:ketosteroid isomerase-like protein